MPPCYVAVGVSQPAPTLKTFILQHISPAISPDQSDSIGLPVTRAPTGPVNDAPHETGAEPATG